MPTGRMFVIVGGLLVLVGAVLMLGDKLGWNLGRLPGDLVWKGKNTTVHFPLMTSLVVSIVLTVLLNLLLRRR
jgi:hypothetical protein